MPFSRRQAPADRLLEVLSELRRHGLVQIVLSGGEPFMHPEIHRILECCVERNILTSVNTNGIYFAKDGNMHSYLSDLAPWLDRIFLNFSLDSIDGKQNNLVRGATSTAMFGIENAIRRGLPARISSVVSKPTLSGVYDLINYYYPEVKTYSFFPVVETTMTQINKGLLLDEADMTQLSEILDFAMNHFPEIKIQRPQRNVEHADAGSLAAVMSYCYCATTKIYIDENLSVYPCTYSKSPRNLMGNLINKSFDSLWKSAQAQRVQERGMQEHLCGKSPFASGLTARYQN